MNAEQLEILLVKIILGIIIVAVCISFVGLCAVGFRKAYNCFGCYNCSWKACFACCCYCCCDDDHDGEEELPRHVQNANVAPVQQEAPLHEGSGPVIKEAGSGDGHCSIDMAIVGPPPEYEEEEVSKPA